jgi:dTDP-4-amino-4,6-dideoxygalactose transaminase
MSPFTPPWRPFHPRHRIDIALGDLLWGLTRCTRDGDPAASATELEARIDARGEVMVTLSARSAFDLLLCALDLPAGSEVLLSAMTIPDMARVVRGHGLVPVPVDLDVGTLAVSLDALERARSPRSRVLVIAHLFGGRVPLAPVVDFARRHALVLVEDDAQGFTGPERLAGHPDADVSLYSFGTIKTATALGGALARVRDPALRARMRALHASHRVQPVARYARKLATFVALHPPRGGHGYALFTGACELAGRDYDALVMRAARGFSASTARELLGALRERPCAPLVELLGRRFATWDGLRVERRREAGEALRAALHPEVPVTGAELDARTHWLFSVSVRDPEGLVRALRSEGFDAARGATSLQAIPAPPERPETAPERVARWMEGVVFLPVWPEIPASERARMADAVRAFSARSGTPRGARAT